MRSASCLVEITERRSSPGTRKRTCADNIKLNFKYTGYEHVIRNQLSQCRFEGGLTANTVLDIRFS